MCGVHETTVIISENLKMYLKILGAIINPDKKIGEYYHTAPKTKYRGNRLVSPRAGITWRGIIEVISTTHELTIIIKEEHVSVLKH